MKDEPGDSERFAHFSVKNLIEIGLMGEKSHSKKYLSKGFSLKFPLKIHNFSSFLAEWNIFCHDILS